MIGADGAWAELVAATNSLCERPREGARLLELAKAYGDARAEEASAAHRFTQRTESLRGEAAGL